MELIAAFQMPSPDCTTIQSSDRRASIFLLSSPPRDLLSLEMTIAKCVAPLARLCKRIIPLMLFDGSRKSVDKFRFIIDFDNFNHSRLNRRTEI